MIDWLAFVIVVVTALVSACHLVTLYSLALRLGDGAAPWRRYASIGMYVLCGIAVAFGIWIIVPFFHQ